MDTWTLQKGYPVVYVERRTNDTNQLIVTQKYFLLNPLNTLQNNQTEYNKYKWFVPFTFTSRAKPNFTFESKTQWLKPDQQMCKFTINFMSPILEPLRYVFFTVIIGKNRTV